MMGYEMKPRRVQNAALGLHFFVIQLEFWTRTKAKSFGKIMVVASTARQSPTTTSWIMKK